MMNYRKNVEYSAFKMKNVVSLCLVGLLCACGGGAGGAGTPNAENNTALSSPAVSARDA